MFGKAIDYRLLRLLAHRENLRTVDEVEFAWQNKEAFEIGFARERLRKWNDRLGDGIPIKSDFRYLDIGCGGGELTTALALEGCGYVKGIDVARNRINYAKKCIEAMSLSDRVGFELVDFLDWETDEKFDVIVSHETLEHVHSPHEFLRKARTLLKRQGVRRGEGGGGGRLILEFGPLWTGPGDGVHMQECLRFQVPWMAVLFSEQALMRIKNEFSRPREGIASFAEIPNGQSLNKMKYSEFLRYIHELDYGIERLVLNPQFKRWLPLRLASNALVRIPWIRDYCVTTVCAILSAP